MHAPQEHGVDVQEVAGQDAGGLGGQERDTSAECKAASQAMSGFGTAYAGSVPGVAEPVPPEAPGADIAASRRL